MLDLLLQFVTFPSPEQGPRCFADKTVVRVRSECWVRTGPRLFCQENRAVPARFLLGFVLRAVLLRTPCSVMVPKQNA